MAFVPAMFHRGARGRQPFETAPLVKCYNSAKRGRRAMIEMTKPKQSGQCPICRKVLQHVSKHIREFHGIKNARERTILNAICTGRVVIGKGTCPVPGCGLFRRRLAIHIERHSDLLPGRRAAYLQVARRDAALKQLSEQRDTDPQPPMASSLDLEDSLASECRHPSCIQREVRIWELESTDKEPAVALHPAIALHPEEQVVALHPGVALHPAVALHPEEQVVALHPDHTECEEEDCFTCFLSTAFAP
uniref:C2H2-type domain-containing protein n=1 Tax=Knipowitschia caucasica TaxID=637954 RepID=A0AAV2LDJ7_KNICA